ncbi:MAG TPA: tetratricopeptide repeat protein [Candidatus Ozemobacteraceae bacterium]|nr:tetratricopeptide repeat protein [Candidatus Ozemobacteraceae bacterium]
MKRSYLMIPVLLLVLTLSEAREAGAGAYDQLIEIGGQPGNVPEPPPPTPVEPSSGYDSSGSSDSGSSSGNSGYDGSSSSYSGSDSSSGSSSSSPSYESGSGSSDNGGSGVPFGGIFSWLTPKPVDPVQKAAEIGSRADRAYSKGNYRDAVKYYKRALNHTPNDASLRDRLAKAERALADHREDRARDQRRRERQREAARKQAAVPPLPPQLRPSTPRPRPAPVVTAQADPFVSAATTRSVLRDIKSRIDALRKSGSIQNLDTLMAKYVNTWVQAITRDDLSEKDREGLQLDIPVLDKLITGGKAAAIGRDQTPATSQEPYYGENKDLEMMLARFNAERAGQGAEMLGEKFAENALPPEIAGKYENVLALGKVSAEVSAGNTPGAIKEIVDIVIGKLGMPRASFAVDGGRIYSNTAFTALNKFMEDSTRAVGGTFDRKEFWNSLKSEMTTGQKAVMEWIGGPDEK